MSWKIFAYDHTDRPELDDVEVRAERYVDLPGQVARRGDEPASLYKASLRELWEHLDGWWVFDETYLLTYTALRDADGELTPRDRLMSGLGDDTVTLVRVPGFFDGEYQPNMLIVPSSCLTDPPADEPYDEDAFREQMDRRHAAQDAFSERMNVQAEPRPAHLTLNNGDWQRFTAIVVPDGAGIELQVKCDGVACRYAGAVGGLLDVGNCDWNWLKHAALARTIGDNVYRNAVHGGGLNVDVINAVLPDGWKVDERYLLAAVEAWVPVVGPDDRPGALTWPNSD